MPDRYSVFAKKRVERDVNPEDYPRAMALLYDWREKIIRREKRHKKNKKP